MASRVERRSKVIIEKQHIIIIILLCYTRFLEWISVAETHVHLFKTIPLGFSVLKSLHPLCMKNIQNGKSLKNS